MTVKNVETNYVEKFVSNSRGAELGFFKSSKQVLECFADKNNLPLYRMAAYVNGKKFGKNKADATGKRFAAPLKRILAVALPNVKLIFKDGKCAVDIDGEIDPVLILNAIAAIEQLCIVKCTIKDDKFDNAFPKPEAAPKEFDAVVWAERQLKTNPDQLEVMIAALQAQRTGLKVAA